jgi:hypothetical protein
VLDPLLDPAEAEVDGAAGERGLLVSCGHDISPTLRVVTRVLHPHDAGSRHEPLIHLRNS